MQVRALGVGVILTFAVGSAAAAAPPAVSPSASSAGVSAGAAPVNVAAFKGLGRLAFVWQGLIYVLDGHDGILRLVAHPQYVSNLAWSHDGRWLAFIQMRSATAQTGRLWLVGADGRNLKPAPGVPASALSLSWSPSADVLAVVVQERAAPVLWVATPAGYARATKIRSPSTVWAPDGRTVAYTVTAASKGPQSRSDVLYTAPIDGSQPEQRYVAQQSGLDLVTWWPRGRGLLFWLDPSHSASLAADGMTLFSMPLSGSPLGLTGTLGYPQWVSWAPNGTRVVVVSGMGREVWHAKHLSVCAVRTGDCHRLPTGRAVVALDPTWSPRSDAIAYVTARDLGPNLNAAARLQTWIRSHTLWLASPSGRHRRQVVTAGGGVYAPDWARDGRHLLYIRNNALWLVRPDAGAAVKLVGPFPRPSDLGGYYGYPAWSFTFAWFKG